jgi:queuosine precursor transporter
MNNWGGFILTILFATLLVVTIILIAERFAGVWAPIWIVGFLVGMSIVFDYGGVKIAEYQLFGQPMTFAAGPMMWPVLALGQDYLNEFYGKRIAINYVAAMFAAKIGVALATLWIIYMMPASQIPDLAETAANFDKLLGQSPRINVASIIAVIAAFGVNAWIFDKLRQLTKGKKLWLRNQVSTMASLTIDAFVFFIGAFLFTLPLNVVWMLIYTYIGVCYLTTFIDLGFLYLMVEIKRHNWLGISSRTNQKLVIQTLSAYSDAPKEQVPV